MNLSTEPVPFAGPRVAFEVYGTPSPQGSKKFVGFRKPKPGKKRGSAILIEQNKERIDAWRKAVWTYAQNVKAKSGALPEGPLGIRVVFTMPKPKSAPKNRRTYPAVKRNDIDKCLRSTCDALTASGLIVDDGHIVEVSRLAKVFPNEDPEALPIPGARIELWSLAEEIIVKPPKERKARAPRRKPAVPLPPPRIQPEIFF